MPPQAIFPLQLVLGYVAWSLAFVAYIWPWLRAMDRVAAQRAIATLHSFRFFGLVFMLPGVVGDIPAGFAVFSATVDLATGVLAMLALATYRVRALFWLFVVAFNLVGAGDLVVDYYNAIHLGLAASAGRFGATYPIPVLYVPLLMITHIAAFALMLRPRVARA